MARLDPDRSRAPLSPPPPALAGGRGAPAPAGPAWARTMAALAVGAVLALPAPAYTFTTIADSGAGLAFPLRVPAVNATGTVAFHSASAGGEGVFTGRGSGATTVATTGAELAAL